MIPRIDSLEVRCKHTTTATPVERRVVVRLPRQRRRNCCTLSSVILLGVGYYYCAAVTAFLRHCTTLPPFTRGVLRLSPNPCPKALTRWSFACLLATLDNDNADGEISSDECDLDLSASSSLTAEASSSALALLIMDATDGGGGATPESIRVTVNPPHAPLGCTIEETLAPQHAPLVFLSAIRPGGPADLAGMQVGDVIVGVSNVFGELTDVAREGVERVKGLVRCRPDDEPLEFQLWRGTNVLAEHERALVELCSRPDLVGLGEDADAVTDQCLQNFLERSYYDKNDDNNAIECSLEDGNGMADNLVDDLYNLWAQELPTPVANSNNNNNNNGAQTEGSSTTNTEKVVKPWSSRSSPSGTYVRDPATGKLKNLDA